MPVEGYIWAYPCGLRALYPSLSRYGVLPIIRELSARASMVLFTIIVMEKQEKGFYTYGVEPRAGVEPAANSLQGCRSGH